MTRKSGDRNAGGSSADRRMDPIKDDHGSYHLISVAEKKKINTRRFAEGGADRTGARGSHFQRH